MPQNLPFVPGIYQPSLTVADLLLRSGQQQADAERRRGEIQAQLWSGLGQTIGQIPQQIQQAKTQQIQQQGLQTRNALEGAQLTDVQQAQKFKTDLSTVLKNTPQVDEDGVSVWNVKDIANQLAAQGHGAFTGDVVKSLSGLNDSFRAEKAAKMAVVQRGAQEVARTGNDPTFAGHFLDQLEKNGSYPKETIQLYRDFIAADPANVAKLTAALSGQPKTTVVPEGASLVNDTTMQPVFKGEPKPPTEAELAAIATDPTKSPAAREAAAAAMKLLKPGPTGSSTERDDERYRNIQASIVQKQPVSPADQAWAAGYEKQKTLGVDRTAAAAGERQASAQTQQNAIQSRGQDFQVAQAARKELTDKVEAPYLTTQASVRTLRDTVDAAKAGNKVAGTLQSLETTMAAIRAQGLNRINAAEIGVTANAGSLYDRVAGWLGKAQEGQPVPPNIQADMQQFADILEKAAYKKYSDSFDSVAKFYGLTEAQKTLKLASPGAAPMSGSVAGVTYKVRPPK